MNFYGCFTPELNHMSFFGQLWHANARSLISRDDDSCRDMGKATLGQLGNRDIPCSRYSTRVCTFMHLGVEGSKQRCNTPY